MYACAYWLFRKNHTNLRLTASGAHIVAVTTAFPSNKWTVKNTLLMCGITTTAITNGVGSFGQPTLSPSQNHQLKADFNTTRKCSTWNANELTASETSSANCLVQSLGWILLLTMVDRNKVINPKNGMFAQIAVELRGKLICSRCCRAAASTWHRRGKTSAIVCFFPPKSWQKQDVQKKCLILKK